VKADGSLAQTPHPAALGSPLTHDAITTDYSEALLEFITPARSDIDSCLTDLEYLHRFTCRHLDGERLWAASMPCVIASDSSIPVARYGNSHSGRMKTVYRNGLGHRYGRLMQTIAGIHYNFSMPEAYWSACDDRPASEAVGDYATRRYLGLIRNFHRWSWLVVYLLGASPAVCASFVAGRRDHGLEPLDADGQSFHLPDATSLRMGPLGYNSEAQRGLHVCYNNLESYLHALREAILSPHPAYAAYSGQRDGEYQQLSDCLLQIENEFYSSIRPKRLARRGETPLSALARDGIEYIEVRCIDVNPFLPLGIDAETMRFLEAFLLFCLISDSPECDEASQEQQRDNLLRVVQRGREPGLELNDGGRLRELGAWASELLDGIDGAARLLDAAHATDAHAASVDVQRGRVREPSRTPSAKLLAAMTERGLPFYRIAAELSGRWTEAFAAQALPAEVDDAFRRSSAASHEARTALEAADHEAGATRFEDYLARYFAQYRALD